MLLYLHSTRAVVRTHDTDDVTQRDAITFLPSDILIREKKSFYYRESRKYTEIVHNRNVYIYSFVLWPCITHPTR